MTETWEEAQDRLFYERHPEIKSLIDSAKRWYTIGSAKDTSDLWNDIETILKVNDKVVEHE